MGTVDHMGRFLDVQIWHPAATSDYLAFATSNLKQKLEKPGGFLAPGLVIFGDNAYSNTHYMVVTPFKGRVSTDEDAFNFYYCSQLRIQVECAFGQLVHCWGILGRPLSPRLGIKRSCHLVLALCRLHNFCANCRVPVYTPMAADEEVTIATASSGINVGTSSDRNNDVEGLLHGGEHDNTNRNLRRQQRRCTARTVVLSGRNVEGQTELPRQRLLSIVVNKGLERPKPRSW